MSKMNRIQEARLPKNLGTKQQDIARMVETSTLPPGLVRYCQQDFETSTHYTKVRFNRETRMWGLTRTEKATGAQEHYESFLRDDVLQEVKDMDALVQAIEQHAAKVVEANRAVEQDEGWQQVNLWLTSFMHGKEYQTFACPETYALLQKELKRRRLSLTAYNLEVCYVHLLDLEPTPFQEYMDRAERKRQAEALTAQRAAEEEAEANEEPTPPIADPSRFAFGLPNRAQHVKRRAEADSENRAKPLAELRREALFSGKKIATTRSTGTGRKLSI